MNIRQKIAHREGLKYLIQFPGRERMDLGQALKDHMRLLSGDKMHFQDARDFMEVVNEELAIIAGERSSHEQSEPERNYRRSHRSNYRV